MWILSIFQIALFAILSEEISCMEKNPAVHREGKLSILVAAPGLKFTQSHFNYAVAFAKILAPLHNVHLLVPHLDDNPKALGSVENIVKIHYFVPIKYMQHMDEEKILKKEGTWRDGDYITHYWEVFRDMLEDDKLMGELKAENFDIGVAEPFWGSDYAFYLFQALKIRETVAIKNYSIAPQHFADLTVGDGKKSLLDEMFENGTLVPVVDRTKLGDHQRLLDPNVKPELKKEYEIEIKKRTEGMAIDDERFNHTVVEHLRKVGASNGDSFRGLRQMFKEISYFFVNTQPEMEWDQGVMYSQVKKLKMIGGIHFKKEHEIKLELKEIFKQETLTKMKGKKRIVYISFGTVVDTTKTKWMNQKQFDAIFETIREMSDYDYFFVWQLTGDDDKIAKVNALPNAFSADFVDQQSILAHPHTKVFMTHCGRNSQLEADYYGVPMVCVPIFMEQFYNAEGCIRKDTAVVLDYKEKKEREIPNLFTKEAIKDAIEKTQHYAKKVREISTKMVQRLAKENPSAAVLEAIGEIAAKLHGKDHLGHLGIRA